MKMKTMLMKTKRRYSTSSYICQYFCLSFLPTHSFRISRLEAFSGMYVNQSFSSGRHKKQAENGLQSRSSENGKTAVWHYGLKLQ